VATVVTESTIYRFAEGKELEKREFRLDSDPAFTERSIIFWKEGRLWALPKGGGKEKKLGAVERRPYQIVASKDHYAWIDKDPQGSFSVQSLRGGEAHPLYRTTGSILTAAMMMDWVFFTESNAPGHFRVGAVSLSGRAPSFTKSRKGRTPSMLAAGKERLYYFDLEARRVVSLSPDLLEERVAAENIVCSPLAIAAQIFCARVEGLFSLPLSGGKPEVLTEEPLGLTARIAASSALLAWASDTGKDEMTLRLMSLGPKR
jgi:hypothetical protein